MDRDHYFKQLNKLSHKISKQTPTANTSSIDYVKHAAAVEPEKVYRKESIKSSFDQKYNLQSQSQPNQPPVYNINKSDFRDVVQKLTGSPAHDRISNPPPIQPPKPPSSRLQRIRPPPLAQVSNFAPNLLNIAAASQNPTNLVPNSSINPFNALPLRAPVTGFPNRPSGPLSPLPPFPAVHAAAESPVSAYMRYLQNSFSGHSPLVSPTPPQQAGFQLPTSPLPFGCLNSPLSQFPLLSPSSFPLSPTVQVPVPSPTWKGH